jgi:nitroreductase
MFAAEAIGLQSCLIGRIVYHQDEIKQLLKIEGNTKIVLGLTVGYAKAKTPHPQKVNRCYDGTYDIQKVKQNQ